MKYLLSLFFSFSLLSAAECISDRTLLSPWNGDQLAGNQIAFEKAREYLFSDNLPQAIEYLGIASQGEITDEARASLSFYRASLFLCSLRFLEAASASKQVLQWSNNPALRLQAEKLIAQIPPSGLLAESLYQIFLKDSTLASAQKALTASSPQMPYYNDLLQYIKPIDDSLWSICVNKSQCDGYFKAFPESRDRVVSIGLALILTNDSTIATYPLEHSPAAKAKIPYGAKLLSINGTPVRNIAHASSLLRQGNSKTKISLQLSQHGVEYNKIVSRMAIDLSTYPPIDTALVSRIYRNGEDSLECKDGCKTIVFPSAELEIQANQLYKYDSLLTPQQAAAFSDLEREKFYRIFYSLQPKPNRSAFGVILGAASLIFAINTPSLMPVGVIGIVTGAILLGSGMPFEPTSENVAALIRNHNQNIMKPWHKARGSTKFDIPNPK